MTSSVFSPDLSLLALLYEATKIILLKCKSYFFATLWVKPFSGFRFYLGYNLKALRQPIRLHAATPPLLPTVSFPIICGLAAHCPSFSQVQ